MAEKESEEYSGRWWIPEDKERKIRGSLVSDPDGGLRLLSSEPIGETNDFPQEPVVPYIFGQTEDSNQITLLQCRQTKQEVRVKQGNRTRFVEFLCEKALIGGHFDDDTITFDKVVVEFPWLTQWVDVTGMQISGSIVGTDETTDDIEDDFVLKYNFPDFPPIHIDGLIFKLLSNTSFEINWGGKAVIEEQTVLQIDSGKTPRSLGSYLDSVKAFSDLLSLALSENINPTRITGVQNLDTESESHVEVLYPAANKTNGSNTIDRHQVVFTYQDLQPNIERTLQAWFRKYDDLKPILDLYFSAAYGNDSYYRDRIVTLLGALESYHQARYEEQYITAEDVEAYFEEQSEDYLMDFTADSMDELQTQFDNIKYASLRHRISELIAETDPLDAVLRDSAHDLIDDIVNARNALVHGTDIEMDKASTADIQAFPALIMEAALLTEVGLSAEKIKHHLQRSYPNLTYQS